MTLGISFPSIPSTHVAATRRLFDYEVIDQIGEGARSHIFAVIDPKTRQVYALKHVKRENDKDDRFIEQVVNEFEVGRKVIHASLRRVVDLKTTRNLLLKTTEVGLVMEMFDGSPLDAVRPRAIGRIVEIYIDVANALEALHSHNFVHCDLKPSNVLVSATGEVKLIDLGQACPVGTEKKRIQGTPDYIAPEQVKCRPVGIRTDIYNLGASIYWSLTGKNVPTLYTVSRQSKNSFLVDDQVPSPKSIVPNVPETLSNLVLECTRSDPRKRPSGMPDVIRRLEIIQHVMKRDGLSDLAIN